MQKCYIAGKITGLVESEYKSNFTRAKQALLYMDLNPISPIDLPHKHIDNWAEYMKEDIIAMLQCSHVYALNNYKESDGATIEVGLAIKLNMTIIYQP